MYILSINWKSLPSLFADIVEEVRGRQFRSMFIKRPNEAIFNTEWKSSQNLMEKQRTQCPFLTNATLRDGQKVEICINWIWLIETKADEDQCWNELLINYSELHWTRYGRAHVAYEALTFVCKLLCENDGELCAIRDTGVGSLVNALPLESSELPWATSRSRLFTSVDYILSSHPLALACFSLSLNPRFSSSLLPSYGNNHRGGSGVRQRWWQRLFL